MVTFRKNNVFEIIRPKTDFLIFSNFKTANTNDNSTIFKIYFQENISLSQEDYILSFLNLVADLGAYLTILLGISVLDGVAYLINCFDSTSEDEEIEEKNGNTAFFVPRSKPKY